MLPPLSERMRPKSLNEISGQKHLLGDGGILTKYIRQKFLPSIIFWGPPGVGKTTISTLLAAELEAKFYQLSAVDAGVKDVRTVVEKAKKQTESLFSEQKSILFIDEIHRFNKAQQDSLLASVEKGVIILIGATTENPSFEVISPLLSRSQVLLLDPLEPEALKEILLSAIKKDSVLRKKEIFIDEYEAVISYSGGDVRKLLNYLELIVEQNEDSSLHITNKLVENILQKKLLIFDKSGEKHYDIISAFIKSLRGSDPNAAAYWLMRLVESGENPKFIARRILILASEDIGNANPNALTVANQCFSSVEKLGYPECVFPLMQATLFMANSPKSNSTYTAIKKAKKLVMEYGDQKVPLHLRNAVTDLMKKMNYGTEYKYPHNEEKNFVSQEYLPQALSGKNIYEPQSNENEVRKYLKQCWGEKYSY